MWHHCDANNENTINPQRRTHAPEPWLKRLDEKRFSPQQLEKLRAQGNFFLSCQRITKILAIHLISGRLFCRGAYAADGDEYDEGDCDEDYDAHFD